jgi:hypothetical protein
MGIAPSPDRSSAEMADRGLQVSVRLLDAEHVLLEGSAEALEAFASIISAQARFAADCGFQLSPAGPGSALFTPESTLGLYVHRLPCTDGHKPRPSTGTTGGGIRTTIVTGSGDASE